VLTGGEAVTELELLLLASTGADDVEVVIGDDPGAEASLLLQPASRIVNAIGPKRHARILFVRLGVASPLLLIVPPWNDR